MKLIGLKDKKLPLIPPVWVGFVLWFVVVGAYVFELSPWVIGVTLGLLFLHSVFVVLQFYAAVATAKATSYMLEAMIATQLLMDEQTVAHMKSKQSEGE